MKIIINFPYSDLKNSEFNEESKVLTFTSSSGEVLELDLAEGIEDLDSASIVFADDLEVLLLDIADAYGFKEIITAAGPATGPVDSSGVNAYGDGAGDLIDGLDRLGSLDPDAFDSLSDVFGTDALMADAFGAGIATGTPGGGTDTPGGGTDTPGGGTDTPGGDTDTPGGSDELPLENVAFINRAILHLDPDASGQELPVVTLPFYTNEQGDEINFSQIGSVVLQGRDGSNTSLYDNINGDVNIVVSFPRVVEDSIDIVDIRFQDGRLVLSLTEELSPAELSQIFDYINISLDGAINYDYSSQIAVNFDSDYDFENIIDPNTNASLKAGLGEVIAEYHGGTDQVQDYGIISSSGKDEISLTGDYTSKIETGDGADRVSIDGALKDNASVKLGAGDNTATVGSMQDYTSIISGDDHDHITVKGAMTDGSHLDLGAGTNTVKVGSMHNSALIYASHESNDNITVDGAMTDTTEIYAAHGDNTIKVGSMHDETFIYAGRGNNSITVAGDMTNLGEIGTGSGNDILHIQGSMIDHAQIGVGSGDDEVIVDGTMSGTSRIFANSGTNIIKVGSMTDTTLIRSIDAVRDEITVEGSMSATSEIKSNADISTIKIGSITSDPIDEAGSQHYDDSTSIIFNGSHIDIDVAGKITGKNTVNQDGSLEASAKGNTINLNDASYTVQMGGVVGGLYLYADNTDTVNTIDFNGGMIAGQPYDSWTEQPFYGDNKVIVANADIKIKSSGDYYTYALSAGKSGVNYIDNLGQGRSLEIISDSKTAGSVYGINAEGGHNIINSDYIKIDLSTEAAPYNTNIRAISNHFNLGGENKISFGEEMIVTLKGATNIYGIINQKGLTDINSYKESSTQDPSKLVISISEAAKAVGILSDAETRISDIDEMYINLSTSMQYNAMSNFRGESTAVGMHGQFKTGIIIDGVSNFNIKIDATDTTAFDASKHTNTATGIRGKVQFEVDPANHQKSDYYLTDNLNVSVKAHELAYGVYGNHTHLNAREMSFEVKEADSVFGILFEDQNSSLSAEKITIDVGSYDASEAAVGIQSGFYNERFSEYYDSDNTITITHDVSIDPETIDKGITIIAEADSEAYGMRSIVGETRITSADTIAGKAVINVESHDTAHAMQSSHVNFRDDVDKVDSSGGQNIIELRTSVTLNVEGLKYAYGMNTVDYQLDGNNNLYIDSYGNPSAAFEGSNTISNVKGLIEINVSGENAYGMNAGGIFSENDIANLDQINWDGQFGSHYNLIEATTDHGYGRIPLNLKINVDGENDSYAMYADYGGVNKISATDITSIAAIDIKGDIYASAAGKNIIELGKSNDIITLDGKVEGSLDISGGMGRDILTLKPGEEGLVARYGDFLKDMLAKGYFKANEIEYLHNGYDPDSPLELGHGIDIIRFDTTDQSQIKEFFDYVKGDYEGFNDITWQDGNGQVLSPASLTSATTLTHEGAALIENYSAELALSQVLLPGEGEATNFLSNYSMMSLESFVVEDLSSIDSFEAIFADEAATNSMTQVLGQYTGETEGTPGDIIALNEEELMQSMNIKVESSDQEIVYSDHHNNQSLDSVADSLEDEITQIEIIKSITG